MCCSHTSKLWCRCAGGYTELVRKYSIFWWAAWIQFWVIVRDILMDITQNNHQNWYQLDDSQQRIQGSMGHGDQLVFFFSSHLSLSDILVKEMGSPHSHACSLASVLKLSAFSLVPCMSRTHQNMIASSMVWNYWLWPHSAISYHEVPHPCCASLKLMGFCQGQDLP